jgi:hypothetical protein
MYYSIVNRSLCTYIAVRYYCIDEKVHKQEIEAHFGQLPASHFEEYKFLGIHSKLAKYIIGRA